MSFIENFNYSRDIITEEREYKWYAPVSQNSTEWVRPYTNTVVFEEDPDGSNRIVFLSDNGSAPGRELKNQIGGKVYRSTKPFYAYNTAAGEIIMPFTMSGQNFGYYSLRDSPDTIYVYSLEDNNQIKFFENESNGVEGTADATLTLGKNETGAFTSSSSFGYWNFLSGSKNFIASKKGGGQDRMILTPARTHHYHRTIASKSSFRRTMSNGAPANSTTYVDYDTEPIVHIQVGDGAGNDSVAGMGYEDLTNTYAWGKTLFDYNVVAPYPETQVKIFYVSGDKYVKFREFNLNGSKTNPAVRYENALGTQDQAGTTTDFFLNSSSNNWKFIANKPIHVVVNDPARDEENLYGWDTSSFAPQYGSRIQFTAKNSSWNAGSYYNFNMPGSLNNIQADMDFTFVGDRNQIKDLLRKIESVTTGVQTGEAALTGTYNVINFDQDDSINSKITFDTGYYKNFSGSQINDYSITPITDDIYSLKLSMYNNRVSSFLNNGMGFLEDHTKDTATKDDFVKFDVAKPRNLALFSGSETNHSRVELTNKITIEDNSPFYIRFYVNFSGFGPVGGATLQGAHLLSINTGSSTLRFAYYKDNNNFIVTENTVNEREIGNFVASTGIIYKVELTRDSDNDLGIFVNNVSVGSFTNFNGLFEFNNFGGTKGDFATNIPPLQGSIFDIAVRTGDNTVTGGDLIYATRGDGNSSGNWKDVVNHNHGILINEPDLYERKINPNIFDNYVYSHNERMIRIAGSTSADLSALSGIELYTGIRNWPAVGGDTTRTFFFQPDREITLDVKHNTNKLKLKNSFTQSLNVGINQNFLRPFQLTFSNRSEKESYAILHFLESHLGYKPFVYEYDDNIIKQKRVFFCDMWSHTFNYKDSNTIQATFTEIVSPVTPDGF